MQPVTLLERFEIGHNLGGLIVGEPDVGHRRARFECRRVQDPLFEIVWPGVRDGSASDLGTAGHAREIWADRTGGARDARDGVAANARLGGNDLRALGRWTA